MVESQRPCPSNLQLPSSYNLHVLPVPLSLQNSPSEVKRSYEIYIMLL
jgi:hypothetical protein